MALIFSVPDAEKGGQNITLNKKSYRVVTRYNSRFGYWALDLYDSASNPIILGEKLLPKKDILSRYLKNKILGGYFFIRSKDDSKMTRDNFGIDKTHTLMFASTEEVDSIVG